MLAAALTLAAAPLALLSNSAHAANVTWLGTEDRYNLGPAWSTNSVPGTSDTAIFGSSATIKSVTHVWTDVGGWTFNGGDYSFDISTAPIGFYGTGITVNSGSVTINSQSLAGPSFYNASTAGSATINNFNSGFLEFHDTSTAGSAIINNSGAGDISFLDSSTAGSATITNSGGSIGFLDSSTAGSATITNSSLLTFDATSAAGSAAISNNNGGTLLFYGSSTAGSATITTNSGGSTSIEQTASGGSARFIENGTGYFDISYLTTSGTTAGSIEGDGDVHLGSKNLAVGSNNLSTTFSGVISGAGGSLTTEGIGTLTLSGANTYTGTTTVDSGTLALSGSLASSQITINSSGEMDYLGASTAGSATINNSGYLNFNSTSTAGNATINNHYDLIFNDSSTAGAATINNDAAVAFQNSSTAGNATINNNTVVNFFGTSTAGNAAITTNSGGTTYISATASGGSASFILNGTGALYISGLTNGGTTAGSIEGDGFIELGSKNLAIGGNNSDSNFSGYIHANGGSLTKNGTGTLTLSGANTYDGGTTINAGTVAVGNQEALGLGDVTMAAGTTIAFAGDYTIANNFGLTGDPTFDVGTGNTVTLSGVISDTNPGSNPGVVEKTGDGVLTLSGANTYSGGTTINAGTLSAQNASALGTGTVTVNSTSAASGSLLLAPTGSATFGNALILNGTGGGNGALNIDSSSSTSVFLNGLVTLGSDATIATEGGNQVQFNETVSGTNTNLAITANSPTVINKNLDLGTGTLTVSGPAGVALNGSTDSILAGVIVQNSYLQLGYTGGVDNKALPANATLTVDGGWVNVLRNETIGALGGTGGTVDIYSGYDLSTGNDSGTSSYSGIISGGGSLTKAGTGTLTLTGTNTYTGGTTIDAGTITVGSNSALGTGDVAMAAGTTLGSASGYLTIANNFGLTGDPTIDVPTGGILTMTGVISDTTPGPGTAGVVEKTGDGTLILSATNTYSGGTILNAGILQVSADNGLGDTSGDLTFNGGTLQWGASFDDARAITLNSGGGTFDTNGYYSTLSGVISGSGALTKEGSGLIELSGANTYTGATTVNNGYLLLSGSLASNQIMINSNGHMIYEFTNTAGSAGSAAITNNGFLGFYTNSTAGNATIENNALIGLLGNGTAGNATITTNSGGDVSFLDTSSGGTARFILNDTGQIDLSQLSASGITAGSIEGDGNVLLGSFNLAVGGNNLDTTFSGVIADGGFNGGTGGSLTKDGTGNLILSGANTYTGATTVNAGTLSVNGSIASSSMLTVNAGGTIGGTGDLPDTVIATGGTLAPGNSIGIVTVNGDLTLTSGSTYAVQVSPSAADETLVTGNATIAGALTTTFANGTYAPGTQYTLINAAGTLSGTFASTSTVNLPYSYAAQLSYDPNNVLLTLIPIVDPKGGQVYATRTTTEIADERMIRDAVLGHLVTPAGASADGISIWGQGFTGYGKFDNAAITHNHAGGIAGVDIGLDSGFRLGLAGAYTTSRTSAPATMAHASGSSGHVVGYASWSDSDLALRGGAAYGWGSSDVTRFVPSLSETDRGHQPGRTAQVFAEAGYSIHAGGGILEPHAGFAWVHAEADAFKEMGAFASFSGSSTSTSATFATLGIRAILPGIPLGAINVTPRFDLGWQHGFDASAPGQSLTLNTTAQTTVISGIAMDRDAATAQVGADIAFAPHLTLHVGYDGLMASHASDNTITARLGWSF